jgi:flagellar assembly protein FliH
MFVEAAAVRVGRAARVGPSDAQVGASPSPQEDARREGYEEGIRTGMEEGRHAGYEEGLRQGNALVSTRTEAAVQEAEAHALAPLQERERQVMKLLESLGTAAADCLSVAEDEMVALCFEVVGQLVGDKAIRPAEVRGLMTHLLANRPAGEAVILHVHPQDAALLEGCRPSGEDDRAGGGARWVADSGVAYGGCVVHGRAGALDLRLEIILESLKRAFLHARSLRAFPGEVAE